MVQPVAHPRLGRLPLVAPAVTMTGYRRELRAPTPELGENTEEILAELGYDEAAISRLRERQAI
jgi:crotonobetainyl-CoA:carnitine CoA-transferase CaiB-like acyl-CoA transferase